MEASPYWGQLMVSSTRCALLPVDCDTTCTCSGTNCAGNVRVPEISWKYRKRNLTPNSVTSESKSLNGRIDRKSTRLNSSHVRISYAVFCLKKKKKQKKKK